LCRLLFSGDDVQDVNQKLHPAIAADREQGQDFRASSSDDGDDCDCGGIHHWMLTALTLAADLKLTQSLLVVIKAFFMVAA